MAKGLRVDDLVGRQPGHVLEQVLDALRELLGAEWTVTELQPPPTDDAVFDAHVQITPPDGHSPYTDLLVIVRQTLTPREVSTQIRQINNVMHHANSRQPLLVASPWISPRTQQALRDHDIAYLDLTGNAAISITYPAIRIYTQGRAKAPSPPSSSTANRRNVTLAGPRAGRVVRFLADFSPPYQATEIATATEVSLPWVSRLLGQLEDQLIIHREGRTITEVKWPELLRARAETYSLLQHNSHVNTVAVNGVGEVLANLRARHQIGDRPSPIAVTGSYAASTVAPLTVGGQLMVYVAPGPHPLDEWADKVNLLRTDAGGDVLLLRAYDDVVFERTRTIADIPYVALSQVVLDGLAGPGRMPAEAERVLTQMIDNPTAWRPPWSPDRA